MASNECTVTFRHLPQSKQTQNWKQLQQQTQEPAQADKKAPPFALYHDRKEEINKKHILQKIHLRSNQTRCRCVNVQPLDVFWTKLQQAQLNKGSMHLSNRSYRDDAERGRMHHPSAVKTLAAQRKKPEGDKYWPWPSEDSFNPFL